MGAELEILSLEFLKKNNGRRYSIRELYGEMLKEYKNVHMNYLSVHKAVKTMLERGIEGLKYDDRRFVIFVWYDDEKRD